MLNDKEACQRRHEGNLGGASAEKENNLREWIALEKLKRNSVLIATKVNRKGCR